VLFIALTLGPGCIFFLYALYHFWHEATAPGHAIRRRSGVILTFVDRPGPKRADAENAGHTMRNSRETLTFAPVAERPVPAGAVPTQLKTRLGSYASGTGRLETGQAMRGKL